MRNSGVRIDIDSNFKCGREDPRIVKVGDTVWSVYRTVDHGIIILKNGNTEYAWKTEEAAIFLMEDYCYYRHKEFQLLLDSFRIDKVKRMKEGEELQLDLICGVRGLDKSFAAYTDGQIESLSVKNSNLGKEHETQIHKVAFDNPTWALVETKNTRFVYRTFYCWDPSPHMLLKDLNKTGLGMAKISS